jgi:hypothetical protein
MSPLQADGEYRGAHASHVHPHYKLGSHRTVLTAALPLVNWLIDDPDVNQIVFGKIAHASGVRYTPRVECTVEGQKLTVLLVSAAAAQGIVLNVRDAKVAEKIAARIRARWESEISGKPMLREI